MFQRKRGAKPRNAPKKQARSNNRGAAKNLYCDAPGCAYTSDRQANIDRHKRSIHQDTQSQQILNTILQRLVKIEGVVSLDLNTLDINVSSASV